MPWRPLFAALLIVLCLVPSARSAVLDIRTLPLDEAVRRFYADRNWALAWSGSEAAATDSGQAISILSRAGSEGLDPQRYLSGIREGDRALADVALTGAVLTYMADLALGRPDLQSIDADMGLPRRSMNFSALLNEALRHRRLARMLADLSPKHEEYRALRAALPAAGDKAETISANMERWRWLPPAFEGDRVAINAASAELDLWLGGKHILSSRVVVGRPSSRTPIFRAEGAGVTVNPSWTIPMSIAAKEILPKLKKDPAWLAKHDMFLIDGPADDPKGLRIDWRAIRSGTFPYQIRQNPGPHNPLGQIKLELPNRFSVYLHDTPIKADFNKAKRQLSHGCVRVEKIVQVATHALGGDITALQKIGEAKAQAGTSYLPLNKKLPVYFLYWTAIPREDGRLQFLEDVYGRDQRLIAARQTVPMRVASLDVPCARG